MSVCDWCGQEMTGKVGCTVPGYMIGGQMFGRLRNEDQLPGCHDCAAPYGTLHHPGCDSETCPRCGGQAISCGCDDPPEDDPDDAEAQRIAEEYADAAADQARTEVEEAHDRAGEQWQEAAYQPAPPDPYSGGVS